jgi:hypothetical protein
MIDDIVGLVAASRRGDFEAFLQHVEVVHAGTGWAAKTVRKRGNQGPV